jgi:hypothetical protein
LPALRYPADKIAAAKIDNRSSSARANEKTRRKSAGPFLPSGIYAAARPLFGAVAGSLERVIAHLTIVDDYVP